MRNSTNGVVLFGSTNVANGNGNDNNTIDSCDIREFGSAISQRPFHGIYSIGTLTTVQQYNSGNTVSNSNIFNYASDTFPTDTNEFR